MDSVAVDQATSRNRSVSNGASELPRHENKRPRLDMEPAQHSQSVSATPHLVSDNSRSRTVSPDPSPGKLVVAATPPPPSSQADSAVSLTISPRSKMTINTRPLSAQSQLTTDGIDASHVNTEASFKQITGEGQHAEPQLETMEIVTKTPSPTGDTLDPMTIASSPEHDAAEFRIEIGSPQDTPEAADTVLVVEGSPAQEIWRRLLLQKEFTDEDLIRHFTDCARILEHGINIQFSELVTSMLGWFGEVQPYLNRLQPEDMLDNSNFFRALGSLLEGLTRRRLAFPPLTTIDDIFAIIQAFSQLTVRILLLETQLMTSAARGQLLDRIPSNIATSLFRIILSLMGPESSIPLFQAVRTSFMVPKDQFCLRLVGRLLTQQLLPCLTYVCDWLLVLDTTLSSSSIARRSIHEGFFFFRLCLQIIVTHVASHDPTDSVVTAELDSLLPREVSLLHDLLQQAIVKQHSWLTIENCQQLLDLFVAICQYGAVVAPELKSFTFTKAQIPRPQIDLPALPDLSGEAIKLAFQKQLIQNGRMELRVSGIDSMANTFVHYWTSTNQLNNPRSEILVNFVIDFVRRNRIIEYLLSVQSHPQIIQRSSNVIGFVCISKNWRQADTDIAWSAILQCEDYRSSSAILDVLKANLEHQTLPALLYLLKQVKTTEFTKFDDQMLLFATDLIHSVKQKTLPASDLTVPSWVNIIDVSLSLLRESQTPQYICTDIAAAVRAQVVEFLGQQNLRQLDEVSKAGLFDVIYQDIDRNNIEATGSILALNTILASSTPNEAVQLTTCYDFTTALVQNMSSLASTFLQEREHAQTASTVDQLAEHQFASRLKCLSSLISSVPTALDDDQCKVVWTDILTANFPKEIRSMAWRLLADANTKMSTQCTLLEFVSSQFMLSLPDSQLDMAVLEYVRSAMDFELRNLTGDIDDRAVLHLSSLEKLWRMVLNTDDDRVTQEGMKYLVKVYLEVPTIRKTGNSIVNGMQNQLLEKCIQIVMSSAQSATGAGASGKVDVRYARRSVYRALNILRYFLDSIKLRSGSKQVARPKAAPALDKFKVEGEPVNLRVRITGHPSFSDKVTLWTVGSENVGADMWQFLTDLTGWSQINLINAGNRLQLQGVLSTINEIKLGPDPLQVSKALHATDTNSARATKAQPASAIDSRVMHHFDGLYALLEADDAIAQAIYDFLTMFSSQDVVVDKVRSMTMTADALLPVTKPYKLLYYAAALRSCIEEESYSSTPAENFLQYAVGVVLDTLERVQFAGLEQTLFLTICRGNIEALQLALKAKVDESVSVQYISHPEHFVRIFVELWKRVQDDKRSRTEQLQHDIFDAMCEAALHCPDVWPALGLNTESVRLLKWSLLITPELELRKLFSGLICRISGVVDGKILKLDDRRAPKARFSTEKIDHCLMQLWTITQQFLPLVFEHSDRCREFVHALVTLFKRIVKNVPHQDLLPLYLSWHDLLLGSYKPATSICIESEQAPAALGRLLTICMSAMKAENILLPDTSILVTQVYRKCLFPPFDEVNQTSVTKQTVPLVEHETRAALYEMTMCALDAPEVMTKLIHEMATTETDSEAFNCLVGNDRKSLRSETGYSGLRNLSNTCYLNSLFSQLFMNLRFRQLIMNMEVVDYEKQKLVHELGVVFANMQNSFDKSVDPTDAVDSIIQYTGESIDVTVQMDVDEFFNLLFDRLESQILDAGAQKRFKSMYGGQLVQQIKSKECEHVSERNEPFSAIQIEIRGKANLQEGLKAYVEGEVLQGDNKYSCTGCNRHVDAIKRACIKEMPDNLIFNLKRFDYDIMTGLRTKVNDEFAFPTEIDMRPYTIEALAEPAQELQPDIFQLVGVIIHSGTAETGHYYSFVRQRPSSRGEGESWVHFNDSEVSHFDFSEMSDQAFGGFDRTFTTLPKFYNGYMLFYQRASSVLEYGHQFGGRDHVLNSSHGPMIPLSQELDNQIAAANELTLRRYVAQDPAHANFVKEVLQRYKIFRPQCSDKHSEEDRLTSVVLNYLSHVSSRWKELPEFENTIQLLVQVATSCWKCARRIAEWFAADCNIMTSILKSSYLSTRKGFAGLLTVSFQQLFIARRPGSVLSPAQHKNITGTLERALTQVYDNWNLLQRLPRGWDQLFGVLVSVAEMGGREAIFLVEVHIFEKVLEIVWVQAGSTVKNTPKVLRLEYQTYFTYREKHRTFNHKQALTLFALLLQVIALDAGEKDRNADSLFPTDVEARWLQLSGDGAFEWLKRLIQTGNAPGAAQQVVQQLCGYPDLQDRVFDTLTDGLENILEYAAAARFTGPCVQFIIFTSSEALAADLLERSLAAVAEADGYCSPEYLEYARTLAAIQITTSGITQSNIRRSIARLAGSWAPPLLLTGDEGGKDVRTDTKTLLNELLNEQMRGRDVREAQDDRMFMQLLRGLIKGCAAYVGKVFEAASTDRTPSRISYSHGQSSQMVSLLTDVKAYFAEEIYEGDEVLEKVRRVIDELEMLDVMAEEEQYTWNDSEPPSEIDLSEVSP